MIYLLTFNYPFLLSTSISCFVAFVTQRITERQNHVVITDRMWARLLSSTNQPSCLDSKGDNEEKKEEEAALNQLPDGHCSKDTSLANKEINSIYPTTC